MNKLLILLLLSSSLMATSWDDDYCYDEKTYERAPIERNDNYYVKGFYGHGYSTQRYSHIDYILNEYDSSDRELGEHIDDYCGGIDE